MRTGSERGGRGQGGRADGQAQRRAETTKGDEIHLGDCRLLLQHADDLLNLGRIVTDANVLHHLGAEDLRHPGAAARTRYASGLWSEYASRYS